MLLHIDGSKHRWLNDDRLDDATSEIYYAQLVEDEDTQLTPVKIIGNLYYVGTRTLSTSVLADPQPQGIRISAIARKLTKHPINHHRHPRGFLCVNQKCSSQRRQ